MTLLVLSWLLRAGPLVMGTVPPTEILQINMTKIPKLPKGALLHREAIWWADKHVHPHDGLDLLFRKLAGNTIILEFIDGAHKDNGLVAVDFPDDCFDGWQRHELRKDCFHEPPARQMITTRPHSWTRSFWKCFSCDVMLAQA